MALGLGRPMVLQYRAPLKPHCVCLFGAHDDHNRGYHPAHYIRSNHKSFSADVAGHHALMCARSELDLPRMPYLQIVRL